MHPLLSNPQELKDSELESKITDLTKKYFQTYNTDLKRQIAQMLDVYKEEADRRRQIELNKVLNQDKGLDKLINVN